MKEQLSKYVELLFAGSTGTEEIRQEILQNSLDRFDDLVSQGKSPEAAYRLTISGIGDINEILGQPTPQDAAPTPVEPTPSATPSATSSAPAPSAPTPESNINKLLRSIAVALYILCAIPVIFFAEIGLCITLVLVAVATGIMVYIGKEEPALDDVADAPSVPSPRKKSKGRILAGIIVWLVGLIVYLTLSILTKGWIITWLIFPMTGCVNGIVRSIFDLKEARRK